LSSDELPVDHDMGRMEAYARVDYSHLFERCLRIVWNDEAAPEQALQLTVLLE
jgi:hypothetical protein